MGGGEKIFAWAASHRSSVTEAGQTQAIQSDISRFYYSCCFLTHHFQEIRQDYISGREGAVSARNTLSFVAEALQM